MEIKFDEQFTIEVPINGIRDEGIQQIKSYLLMINKPCPNRHDESFEWVWLSKKGGTLTKRLARWVRVNTTDDRLTPKEMSEIGNLAARNCDKQSSYLCDYSKGSWNAGEFGDNGSCFWSDRSGARDMIRDLKGFAFREYDPETKRGIGRCWVAPLNKCHVLFNGYHSGGRTLIHFARLFATARGQSYKKIELTNHGSDNGLLWINNGTGYLVGGLNDIHEIESYDFELDEDDYKDNCEDMVSCVNCERTIHEEDAQYAGDDWYCEGCYNELYASCARCGNDSYHEDMRELYNGDRYCPRCANAHTFECCGCSELFDNQESDTIEDDEYCEGCAVEKRAEEEKQEQGEGATTNVTI